MDKEFYNLPSFSVDPHRGPEKGHESYQGPDSDGDLNNLNVLLLAPQGQDSKLAAQVLREVGIQTEILNSLPELCTRLNRLAGALVIAEEAINDENRELLNEVLARQETWSDLPIVLLTLGKGRFTHSKRILEFFGHVGNISLLERPFSIMTFTTMTKVALRAREKQYLVKDLLLSKSLALKKRDEFLSIASHELKTPITGLKLQIQLRKRLIARGDRTYFDPEKVNSFIETADHQIERLHRLVDEMLDVTRIENGKLSLNLESCELGDIVSHVVESMAVQFNAANVELNFHIEKEAKGYWDRYRIEQVVLNLLTNALKYGRSQPVSVIVSKDETCAFLKVKDQGAGIPLEDQAKIFERFERAVSGHAISGLGLGLYISKQIVNMHHGSITLESREGVGSTFIVKLPLS